MCDQVTARVSIAFNDVAAYFSEEEWSRLEDWEKELYRSVMKEIHGALISLGYAIVNPDILLRIKQVEEPCGKHQQAPVEAEILKSLTTSSPVFNPEVSLWIKEVEESGTTQEPESQSKETPSSPSPAPTDHPFIKPDILLRIQQIEETIVPEHWVFEEQAPEPAPAPVAASSPTPCYPVYQSVFPADIKNEGQPCDSEEREAAKHPDIDFGAYTIVTVTDPEDYVESTSQQAGATENIPLCFDEHDTYQQQQRPMREKRCPPRYLVDGSFECEYEPDYGPMTMVPVTNSQECIESTSQSPLGEATIPLYFDEQNTCQRLQRQKRCPPNYPPDRTFECKYDLTNPFGKKAYPMKSSYQPAVYGKHFHEEVKVIKNEKIHTTSEDRTSGVCVKGFTNPEYSNYTQRSRTEEPMYWCDVCEKNFSNSYKLRVHQRNHTGEKPYKCVVCGKCFGMNAYLKFHIRTHTGERPFVCKVCGKGFTKPYHLKVHMRIHTGEKPYNCLDCGKRFTVNSHLKAHRRTHNRVKPVLFFNCRKSYQ